MYSDEQQKTIQSAGTDGELMNSASPSKYATLAAQNIHQLNKTDAAEGLNTSNCNHNYYQHADTPEWEDEVKMDPFVGPLVPLERISKEFIPGSNAYKKITFLCGAGGGNATSAAHVRKVRRDGCCFYRGFMFGLCEQVAGNKEKVEALKRQVENRIIPKLEATGYRMATVSEFVEEMKNTLNRLESPEAGIAEVEDIFNDAGVSNYLVVFARLSTAAEMKSAADDYLPFLSGHSSVEQFCAREVEPMWTGVEQPQILALTSAFDVSIEITYVDQSPGSAPARHVFPESAMPSINLLYRPGHYDILYCRYT